MAPAQLRRHGSLRRAVAKGEEERDGDRVRLDLGQRLEVERYELAAGTCAPANAEAALERDKGRSVLGARAVEVRAGLTAQMQEVLEALVRHERRPGSASLEERVRRNRCPVREAAHLSGAHGRRGGDHRLLLASRGRHLGNADLSVRDEHGVRERAADVDSERAHRAILDHTAK
jgi:hypothetical protein